ncbi:MAG: hypothetical protein ACXADH_05050, partial [Candidatus Kariarchaeaceae archaeon]
TIGVNSTGTPGEFVVRFILPAQSASQLGIGEIILNLTLVDEYGHRVMSSSDDFGKNLESKDFVTLIGLQWIYTPYGAFTFNLGTSPWTAYTNATEDLTFRISLGEEFKLSYRIYALEAPLTTITESQIIFWETPWNTSYPLSEPMNVSS